MTSGSLNFLEPSGPLQASNGTDLNKVLIKPSLYNNVIIDADYCYNYWAKQHVSALLGHHQAYQTVVLVKVHSVVFTYGIFPSCFLLIPVTFQEWGAISFPIPELL